MKRRRLRSEYVWIDNKRWIDKSVYELMKSEISTRCDSTVSLVCFWMVFRESGNGCVFLKRMSKFLMRKSIRSKNYVTHTISWHGIGCVCARIPVPPTVHRKMRPAKNGNPCRLIGHIPSDSLPTQTQKERRESRRWHKAVIPTFPSDSIWSHHFIINNKRVLRKYSNVLLWPRSRSSDPGAIASAKSQAERWFFDLS